MSLLSVKLAAILVMFLVGCLGGLAALRTRRARGAERLFALGSLFGGGVFLGAGFIHMLPDSVEALGQLYPDLEYPLSYAVAALGLIAILGIDRLGHRLSAVLGLARPAGTGPGAARPEGPAGPGGQDLASALILLLVLSFHSILAGAAIGAEESTANSLVLLIAILAHKGSAAFALTTSLLRSEAGAARIWPLLLAFSLMTPLGVLGGHLLQEALSAEGARLAEGIFDALAAATFVYVATLEVIGPEFRSHEGAFAKIAALAAGLAVMALVAVWL